jgi:hypothetical protein
MKGKRGDGGTVIVLVLQKLRVLPAYTRALF